MGWLRPLSWHSKQSVGTGRTNAMSLFILAMLLGTLQWPAEKSFDTTVSPGSATVLAIREDNGDISLHAADTDHLSVHAKIHAHTLDALGEIVITAAVQGNQLKVGSTCPQTWRIFGYTNACEIDYDITYPKTLDVNVVDTNGDITIDGAAGNVVAHLTNGDVTVKHALRSLDLSSRHGDVSAELSPLWQGSSIVLASSMGDVTIAVPPGFDGYLDAKTHFGDVENRAALPSGSASARGVDVRLSSIFGDVIVRSTQP